MLSGSQFEQIVIDYLTPDLSSFIAGDICRKDERNSGSDEDVTIECLSYTDGSPQLAIVLVKPWKKDRQVRNEDLQKIDWKADNERLGQIEEKVIDILKGRDGIYWKQGNLFAFGGGNTFDYLPGQEHFKAIRVKIRAYDHDSPQ